MSILTTPKRRLLRGGFARLPALAEGDLAVTPRGALAFVKRHGIVLESARGPVRNMAERVAGGAIRGSWWSHPQAQAIFRVTRRLRASPDVLVCRLVGGKVTYVHRRLWPALVRLARELGARRLAALREVHTAKGEHVLKATPFPRWVPKSVQVAGRRLGRDAAVAALGGWLVPSVRGRRR